MLTTRFISKISAMVVLLLLFFSPISLAEKEGNATLILSLEDCIKLALENNEKVRGAGFGVEAAEGQATEARASFWPVVEYKYRVAPVPTDAARALDSFFEGEMTIFNSLRVGMGMPLFASGQLRTAKRMGEYGIEVAQNNQKKESEQVALDVKKLYNGILLAGEVEALISDSTEKILNKVKEQEEKEIPDYSPFDLLKLKMFNVELEKRLAETRQNKELAVEGLKIQMGLSSDENYRLDTKTLKPRSVKLKSLESYLEDSVSYIPDLQTLDVAVDLKKSQYKLEKQKLGPNAGLGFFVDIGRTANQIRNLTGTDDFNDPFDYTRAGIGLEISGKLDIHGASGRIRKAKAEYMKAAYESMIAKKGLKLKVREAYLKARRWQENVERADRAESMARQMLFLSKSNMEIGVGDNEEYREALQAVLLTRGQYFEAVFNYNVALAELEQQVGRLNKGD